MADSLASRRFGYDPSGSTLFQRACGRRAVRFPAVGAAVSIASQVARQFFQRLAVDLALEVDHRVHRHPILVPAPGIEFRFLARTEAHVAIPPREAQEKPDLFLAAVMTAPVAPEPAVGYLVAQPLARAAEDLHVLGVQPDLFLQLAIH